jgi:hypothetical protein
MDRPSLSGCTLGPLSHRARAARCSRSAEPPLEQLQAAPEGNPEGTRNRETRANRLTARRNQEHGGSSLANLHWRAARNQGSDPLVAPRPKSTVHPAYVVRSLRSDASRRREPRPPERGRSPDAGASRDPTGSADLASGPDRLLADSSPPGPDRLLADSSPPDGSSRTRRRGTVTITGVLKSLIQTLLWHVASAYHLFFQES